MIRVLFISFLILACPAHAQTVEEDKGYLVELLEENLSGDEQIVTINGFKGALSSEASIASITVADSQGIWLEMTGAKLIWTRSALLRGAIDVDELSAETLSILRPPIADASLPSSEASPFSLPDLPVSLSVDTLNISHINLGAQFLGEAITLSLAGSASLAGGDGSVDITATRLDQNRGTFSISGRFSNSTEMLDLDVALNEDANGIIARLLDLPDKPALSASIVGAGLISDYTAELGLATDGQNRLMGNVTLSETELGSDFSLNVQGDITPLFAPEYQSFFGPDVTLRSTGIAYSAGGVSLRQLELSADHVTLSGSAEISAMGWPERLSLSGEIARPDGEMVLLPLAGPKTHVMQTSLDIAFDRSISDRWRAQFLMRGLERHGLRMSEFAIDGSGVIDEITGRVDATVAYGASGLEFDDAATSQALGSQISGRLHVIASQGEPTRIETLSLHGAGLDFAADATILGPSEGFETSTNALMTVAALERFQSLTGQPLAGATSLAIVGSVRPLDGIFDLLLSGETTDLAIGNPYVDPLTRGVSNLSLRAARNTDGTEIEGLQLITKTAKITANARLNSAGGRADVRAHLTDVSLLDLGISGHADLNVSTKLDEKGLISFDVAGQARDLNVDATGSIEADDKGRLVNINLTTNVTDLRSYASLVNRDIGGAINAQVSGSLREDMSDVKGTITLSTQDLAIGSPTIDQLLSGTGTLTASLNRSGSQVAVNDLEISTPNLTVAAALDSNSTVGKAEFTARLRDVGLFTETLSGHVTASGSATRHNNFWHTDIDAAGPGGISLLANGQYRDDGQLAMTVTGAAPLGIANAAIEPRRLSGIANFNLSIDGPPSVASLSGQISTRDARLAAPTLSQALENIAASVTIQRGSAKIELGGNVRTGGRLTVNGPVELAAPNTGDVNLQLANVVLRDPNLYQTTVNGTINANGPLSGGARVSGILSLGATEIQVPSSGVGALGNLPNVAHFGQSSAVNRTLERAGVKPTADNTGDTLPRSAAFPLDIVVNAPSRIFIRGRGLDAELGGALTIGGTSNDVQPVGRFDLIRGRLNILQQRFDLTQGSATLQGEFEPHLRLVAETEADTGTLIRIVIEGPASEPEVRFESSPELPQDEVLSQLIFGRDISEISPLQAIQLASAVGTLAGRGGGSVIDNFRQGLGLDDFDVTTDADGNAAVRAGAYISENVYTDVTVSSDGSTEINLNLDITNDVTAKGSVDADGETSIGIFYEKDY